MSTYKDIENIVEFLKNTLVNSRTNGYILGLSGGIDSSVVAVLANMAVIRANYDAARYSRKANYKLKTLIMPMGNKKEDAEDALLVAEHLALTPITLQLDDTLAKLSEALGVSNGSSSDNVDAKALGNVKARLRMISLYYYANIENLLVLGTDNLTETYTGYFTKHGDGAADVFPISDFVKREVYEMAKTLRLPDAVILKAPSAGLWEGQTDEEEMGVPYNFIDNVLEELYSANIQQYGEDISSEYARKLSRLHLGSEHKRNPPHIYRRDKN